PNALKLSAANVLQILALRRSRGSLVEIDGNPMPLPNLLADVTSHGNAVFNAHTFDWNERNNISCAEARMRSLMSIQVNQLSCLASAPNRGFLNGVAFADESDHTTVVVGIHLAVEKVHAVELHGLNDGINFGFIPPFREIRDALHQGLHK